MLNIFSCLTSKLGQSNSQKHAIFVGMNLEDRRVIKCNTSQNFTNVLLNETLMGKKFIYKSMIQLHDTTY